MPGLPDCSATCVWTGSTTTVTGSATASGSATTASFYSLSCSLSPLPSTFASTRFSSAGTMLSTHGLPMEVPSSCSLPLFVCPCSPSYAAPLHRCDLWLLVSLGARHLLALHWLWHVADSWHARRHGNTTALQSLLSQHPNARPTPRRKSALATS